jgi:CxxC-x17-CxxC domain-containing protein
MSYATDITLTCRDCSREFDFTAGEQDFYAQKGFTNQPTRCASCRQAYKASRSGDRDGYGSRDNNGSRSSYGSDRGQRELHAVRCSACGQTAQVPFVPRGDKPVYCSDCFRNQRSTSRW